MSPTNVAMFFVSLVIISTATDVAPGTEQFQSLLSSQEHEKPQFLTVRGTIIVPNTSFKTKDKLRELERMILYL